MTNISNIRSSKEMLDLSVVDILSKIRRLKYQLLLAEFPLGPCTIDGLNNGFKYERPIRTLGARVSRHLLHVTSCNLVDF